jgi:hypothetical protein
VAVAAFVEGLFESLSAGAISCDSALGVTAYNYIARLCIQRPK